MQADLVNKKLLDAKEVCERLWGSCEEKYYKRTKATKQRVDEV